MADIVHWAAPRNGDFSTAADWAGGAVPDEEQDAYLDATGHPFRVTVTTTTAVNGVDLSANASLYIAANQGFAVLYGTDAGANAGLISVGDSAQLDIAGVMDNHGTIALAGTAFDTRIVINRPTTLTGGGAIQLGDSTGTADHGITGIAAITNVDNMITGAGYIDNDGFSFVNATAGVIDADGVHTLTLFELGTIMNAGLIEATGSGGLALDYETVLNTGTIAATGAGVVTLDGATVVNSGAGVILPGTNMVLQGATVSSQTLTVAAGQTITVAGDSNSTLLAAQTLTNSGQIAISAGADLALLNTANGEPLTLSGGGEINLGSNGWLSSAKGHPGYLVNLDNTIVGGGLISPDFDNDILGLNNEAEGVIDAKGYLTIESCSPVINAGLLEATSGALTIEDETVDGDGGQVLADGGAVYLIDTKFDGGSLATEAGISSIIIGGASAITGAAITNAGLIEAGGVGGAKTRASIRGPIDNLGTLAVTGGARLLLTKPVSGAGIVSIDDGTLKVRSKITEDVVFSGASGKLALGRSQGYTGEVSGFSQTGGDLLDLMDIGFASAGEATFSGTTASGVLTVTDGTHTARITLIGDYTGVSFEASADGQGGTLVADQSAAASVARPTRAVIAAFASAIAGLGSHATVTAHVAASLQPTLQFLVADHTVHAAAPRNAIS
jgi:hypothetical protein